METGYRGENPKHSECGNIMDKRGPLLYWCSLCNKIVTIKLPTGGSGTAKPFTEMSERELAARGLAKVGGEVVAAIPSGESPETHANRSYYFRERLDNAEYEVGFATHAELIDFIETNHPTLKGKHADDEGKQS